MSSVFFPITFESDRHCCPLFLCQKISSRNTKVSSHVIADSDTQELWKLILDEELDALSYNHLYPSISHMLPDGFYPCISHRSCMDSHIYQVSMTDLALSTPKNGRGPMVEDVPLSQAPLQKISTINPWLVVWNMFFHILGIIYTPIWLIFFRGVETTNQVLLGIYFLHVPLFSPNFP